MAEATEQRGCKLNAEKLSRKLVSLFWPVQWYALSKRVHGIHYTSPGILDSFLGME